MTSRYFILLRWLCCALSANATTDVINVGLFGRHVITTTQVTPVGGGYYVFGNEQEILNLLPGQTLQLSLTRGKINVKTDSGSVGTFNKVRLYRNEPGVSFKIKATTPSMRERQFHDNLFIHPNGDRLKLVNNVEIEHYIAGVVESEAGYNQRLEYYKVQAIICRTYALTNLDRHLPEGYNLCNEVHCQAYKGMSRQNALIRKATFDTKGNVLVDADINLINASYHSNCGGQTANSEDVWKQAMPYLRSRPDTFCLDQPSAIWERKIKRKEWLQYLKHKYNYPIKNPVYLASAVNFKPKAREIYLTPLDSSILTTHLRKDWQLRSAQFSIEESNGYMLLKGQGYGHGVGLCQQGAISMARTGYKFTDILHYYYKDVHLIDLSVIDFFRED